MSAKARQSKTVCHQIWAKSRRAEAFRSAHWGDAEWKGAMGVQHRIVMLRAWGSPLPSKTRKCRVASFPRGFSPVQWAVLNLSASQANTVLTSQKNRIKRLNLFSWKTIWNLCTLFHNMHLFTNLSEIPWYAWTSIVSTTESFWFHFTSIWSFFVYLITCLKPYHTPIRH